MGLDLMLIIPMGFIHTEVTHMVMVLALEWVVEDSLEVVEGAVHLVEVEAVGGGKKVLTAFPLYKGGLLEPS